MSDWKVNPDNRRRLLQLQKVGANKKCVDCNAPNPQWASPKFGIFICLECAGTHRSLGVHISFVRSITMDQFKPEELIRMEKGGNEPFNEYMSSHGIDLKLPQKIKYDNPIAEDYKEKLTCEVEGKEFSEPSHPDFDPSKLNENSMTDFDTTEAKSAAINKSRSETPLENRRSQTPKVAPAQKEKNEAYFAELGRQNQEKPANLPPSQGGKYQGFGSTPVNNGNSSNTTSNNTLSMENFQNDPLGTFTKGWSMFSSAVTKSIEDVNESVIKPGVQQWQSGELSEETKRAAAQFGQKFQETSNYGKQAFSSFTKNLQEQYYNNYGNPNEAGHSNDIANSKNSNTAHETEDNWDDF
ncbi:hypothetical protein KAFR_0F00260 [Kazachstania africana CBS 2517]|uniref:Arf-GAP domain-containing protein n=1 Tax=Kazachstania africana (strain ATCC 22294 / BCRC 22015 / CBS 2517 / CECT 1963 / NBRC 1671 / NRRL Y-8276) TaxID=1071382 RepID=H2AW73_KAZAF|nr:hypothetical protein KAFR_0F00260 [Kazachstania africana CBS 2517]CCF58623.1 hypothetical protein KAFR_0F00260 [Kazachstania africana CBS 2517]